MGIDIYLPTQLSSKDCESWGQPPFPDDATLSLHWKWKISWTKLDVTAAAARYLSPMSTPLLPFLGIKTYLLYRTNTAPKLSPVTNCYFGCWTPAAGLVRWLIGTDFTGERLYAKRILFTREYLHVKVDWCLGRIRKTRKKCIWINRIERCAMHHSTVRNLVLL